MAVRRLREALDMFLADEAVCTHDSSFERLRLGVK
jgi:hypothetical protein